MEKALEFNLKVKIDNDLPQLPVLHDYKINEMKIENDTLIISSADVANHDDNSFVYTGFVAKTVQVEFIFCC